MTGCSQFLDPYVPFEYALPVRSSLKHGGVYPIGWLQVMKNLPNHP
jgi:hypothetical protein